MKETINFFIFTLLIIYASILISCDSRDEKDNSQNMEVLSGPYLGQVTPSDSAKLFAPGVISTGYYERDLTINPSGDELFFGISVGNINTILQMKQVNGKWTKPFVPSFAEDRRFITYEPCFSPNGKQLYFLSTRPTEGEKIATGFVNQNIFVVDKLEDGTWSEPRDIGQPINTKEGEFFPSIAKSGNMYFTRSYPESGKSFIYVSKWIDGQFSEPELLPENVNKEGSIYNACISPDESYLIGCASGREENRPAKTSYYYIFFNLGDGQWSNAINLGAQVNLPDSRCMAQSISPDGKYLFFSSTYSPKSNTKKLSTNDIYNFYKNPQNGSMDIYWISTDFIQNLKPE